MATQLQLRRGTTAENNTFAGGNGEVTVDTQTHGLRVHDGTTVGGFLVDTVVDFQLPTAGNNYTWYRKYSSGWVEQGGYATTSGNTGAQITLPVTMSDAHYLINGTCDNDTTGGVFHFMIYQNQTTTGFAASPAYAGELRTGAFYWEVKGMAA